MLWRFYAIEVKYLKWILQYKWRQSCSANVTRWLSDVPYPTVWIVILFVSWICNFKVLDLESGDIIHWNFKIHWDWPNLLSAFCCCRLFQSNLCYHVMLNATLEFLNTPLCDLIICLVFICLSLHTLWKLKSHVSCCPWHWELQNYWCRKVILRVLSSHLHRKL